MFQYRLTEWPAVQNKVTAYYSHNKITVDSFWEDHVVEAQHYIIYKEGEAVGYFAIHQATTLVLFYLEPLFRRFDQQVFRDIKQFEKVTNAMVSTADEFFLSQCIDAFSRLEKQAYFCTYTGNDVYLKQKLDLVHTKADVKDCKYFPEDDFFGQQMHAHIHADTDYYEVRIFKHQDELVGYGVIEFGRVVPQMASVGMFVMPQQRQKGYAANILKALQEHVSTLGFIPRSGCWYYNHNSKKAWKLQGVIAKPGF